MIPKRIQTQPLRRFWNDPAQWRLILLRVVQVLVMAAILLILVSPVYAQTPTPGNPSDGINKVIEMFKKLAGIFIQISFALMFIVFAVGSVKNGLGANIAHQFGISHRLSQELLNLAGGVVIFALGLLTLTFVNYIIGQLTNMYDTTIQIPVPPIHLQ